MHTCDRHAQTGKCSGHEIYSECCTAKLGFKPVAITSLKLCAIKNKNSASVRSGPFFHIRSHLILHDIASDFRNYKNESAFSRNALIQVKTRRSGKRYLQLRWCLVKKVKWMMLRHTVWWFLLESSDCRRILLLIGNSAQAKRQNHNRGIRRNEHAPYQPTYPTFLGYCLTLELFSHVDCWTWFGRKKFNAFFSLPLPHWLYVLQYPVVPVINHNNEKLSGHVNSWTFLVLDCCTCFSQSSRVDK